MRTVFMLLATLLVAAAVASWSRSGVEPDPLARDPRVSAAKSTPPISAADGRGAAPLPPERKALAPEASLGSAASSANPVVELVERAPFLPDVEPQEAFLTDADAEPQEEPAPAAVGMGGRDATDRSGAGSDRDLAGLTSIERSAEWVRRLLALYEALRE